MTDRARRPARSPVSRRRVRVLAAAALLLSTGATLLAVEAALRIRRGGLFSATSPAPEARMTGGRYPGSWDARLGFVPTPHTKGRIDPWRTRVTIDADGLRTNGPQPRPPGPAILAVGDSFTFGDEVDDGETWPAALERRIGRPVWNGGVFGYGLDQMVLRAEALLTRGGFDTLIVSAIPDDVLRCAYSYRFGHKPYFDLEAGELVLRNVPVPTPDVPAPGENGLRRTLRRSFLAELVAQRLDPPGWLVRGNVRVHRREREVAVALIDRLADQANRLGHALLLVAAWHPGARTQPLAPALARADARGVAVLRLETVLRRAMEARDGLFTTRDRAGRREYGHMTAEGNELVAGKIAQRLLGQHATRAGILRGPIGR